MSVWRQVQEFPNYIVNEYGIIKHERRDSEVRSRLNNEGFLMVSLMQGREQLTRSVALLVANEFLPDPEDPRATSIIHLNGDRTDCRAMNLMWRPRWYAQRYHDMFDCQPYDVRVYLPQIDRTFSTLRDFCTTYGIIEKYAYSAMVNNELCYPGGWEIRRV